MSRRGGHGATLGIIDSQTAKAGQKGASINPSGAAAALRPAGKAGPGDAGKQTKGHQAPYRRRRARHAATLKGPAPPACRTSILAPSRLRMRRCKKHPSIQNSSPMAAISSHGYQQHSPKSAAATLSIVKRPQSQGGFVPLPKRWIVERTFTWISNCRRLARDYERHIKSGATFVKLAMIKNHASERPARKSAHKKLLGWALEGLTSETAS